MESKEQEPEQRRDELIKYQELPLIGKFIEDDSEHAYKNINDFMNSVLEPKKPLDYDTDEEEEKKKVMNQLDNLNLEDGKK